MPDGLQELAAHVEHGGDRAWQTLPESVKSDILAPVKAAE